MFESALMRQYATAAGLSEATLIVNTCAVTREAERQARQAIRRLKREQPDMQIIVTGCAAHLNPESFTAMPEVNRVLNNAEKLLAENWRGEESNSSASRPGQTVTSHNSRLLLSEFAERTRAFLPVQQGCNHRCTFCTIPLTRGPSRSLSPAQVVAQACALTTAGYRELVLTGIDLTAYGLDLSADDSSENARYGVGRLIEKLLMEVPGLERLRLSSLDPAEIEEELFAIFGADRRCMPHIHLSIQAGDDLILKRMKRRHSRADVIQVTRRLQALRPEMTLGADFIVGFPTESEVMFTNTLRLVAECGLTHLHIFPFSVRPGTAAARMPAVASTIVQERAARLRAVAAESLASLLACRVGTLADVLLEKPNFGYSEDYLPVRLSSTAVPGTIVRVRLATATATDLHGDILP
ncbi:tRNA-t(6)A37 methylthiotransferase [invertebrate metagenome]|uniref:tRNA-t(6)A37 methylthiotransferase n=1 Tax=invertebrate metagenome TaxID=1711999 RepID=A0A484H6F7_9ZZZZ